MECHTCMHGMSHILRAPHGTTGLTRASVTAAANVVVVVVVSPSGTALSPSVSQRLQVVPEAAGQGCHGVVVPQVHRDDCIGTTRGRWFECSPMTWCLFAHWQGIVKHSMFKPTIHTYATRSLHLRPVKPHPHPEVTGNQKLS